MSFHSLGLRDELLSAVKSRGYSEASPIQQQAIPAILAGKDLLASAQTGTGKTAAFALPILQLLSSDSLKIPGPRCLVLTPTRELASQVEENFQAYGKRSALRSTVIFGGVGQKPQVERLRQGIDILVSTPGRLLDLNQQGHCPLNRVTIFVLDEADRMLDMGFIHDIRKILKALPPHRQNLLFSATYSPAIRNLASKILKHPQMIDVAPRNTAVESIEQSVYAVSKTDKRLLLSRLIREKNWYQALVFTRTKHGANRLTKLLNNDGITATAIHGNKSQNARSKALNDFKRGKLQTLIATDIAARGLDIKELPHVVNYELPHVPEDYIHRIGRTGRAGKEGEAISLVCLEEAKQLDAIERLLQQPIPRKKIDGIMEENLQGRAPFVKKPENRPQGRRAPGARAYPKGRNYRSKH